jgi:hypothetical protein
MSLPKAIHVPFDDFYTWYSLRTEDQTELDTLIGVRTFTELMARSLLLDSTSKPISAGDPVTYLFRIGHEL